MALPINRLAPEPVGVDAIHDSVYSDFPQTGTGAVTVFVLATSPALGLRVLVLANATSAAINPNADTTYDAADINSLLLDGPGATVYIKSSATAWTEVT